MTFVPDIKLAQPQASHAPWHFYFEAASVHVNYLQSATSLAMQAQHAAARPLTRALSSHDVMIK